ncbi:FAD-dependent oxidoreductase [Actinoplanes sp. NBRC 101535]|uniref:NAD(P)/FAD-dependent oxidoreductase n=1 Tax=Actinoplanes sp. NBRC 101535 TaxID=3032196 RepID=UPI0025557623|nr:FAD-dependent oxidoreductase [Actinoplanes sp. NBRC 101535]
MIVGASAGGIATAEALRRSGYDGGLTLVGDEVEAPYDRPPLSKQFMLGRWTSGDLALRTVDALDALDLDLRLGCTAIGLDPDRRTVTVSDGVALDYDTVVLATGVRARRLPGTEGLAGVYTLRSLSDALAFREQLRPGRHLVIVGAGFVGAEVAATAVALGVRVTLLESGPVPLAAVAGTEVGRFLAAVHAAHGVTVRTGAVVAHIEASAVMLADGTRIAADVVLMAIGTIPNTEWLAGSGLTLDDGVVCDGYCAAAPGVYAVGDVARWYNPLFGEVMRVEHRTNAAEQGLAVARALSGQAARPFAPVPYFWSDQYDVKIQAYGVLRGHDEALVMENNVDTRRMLVAYRRGQTLTGVLAVGVSPRTLRAWRALIAARTPWAAALTDMTPV